MVEELRVRERTFAWNDCYYGVRRKRGHKSGISSLVDSNLLRHSNKIFVLLEIRSRRFLDGSQKSFMWTSLLRSISSFTLDLGRFKHFSLKISPGRKGFMLAGPQVKLSFSGQSGSCRPWPRCPTTEPPPWPRQAVDDESRLRDCGNNCRSQQFKSIFQRLLAVGVALLKV